MEKYIPFEIDGELYYSTKDAGEIMGFEENTIIRWAVMGSDTFSYEKVDKNRSIKNYCWGATLVDMYFSDPDGFAYIIENREKSPIVLLSGPSGSGKTTTAMKISEALEKCLQKNRKRVENE